VSVAPCSWCDEPFVEGETIESGHVHYECGLRAVIGSVGHQRGLCWCYGGNEEDPPGATRRQAASAAATYFHFGVVPTQPAQEAS
jgi:hypothetical protein